MAKSVSLLVRSFVGSIISQVFTFFFYTHAIEVAKCLNSKIYVADQKRAMLEALHDEELNQALTNEPQDAQVHVIPLWHILPEVNRAIYAELLYILIKLKI